MSNNNTQPSVASVVAANNEKGRLYGITIHRSDLRREPALISASIQNVARDTRVMILGTSDNRTWTQVEIGRNVGWLRSQDLRETKLHGQAKSNGALRSGPTSSFSEIHSFTAGTGVMVLSINGNRSFVQIGTRTGWMANSRLALVERQGEARSNGTLRSGPTSSFSEIYSFTAGTSVMVFSVTGNRSLVRIGNRIGWMANSRLALIDRQGHATSDGALRSGPTSSSPRIYSFTRGTKATPVYGINGNRSLVRMGKRIGWMANSRLALDERNYNTMNRKQLAQEILNRHNGTSSTNRRINLLTVLQDLNNTNRRSAFANIEDTAKGGRARTPWGHTDLSPDLLSAILRMNDRYGTPQVNTIAGGTHLGGVDDPHARGLAVDLQSTNHVVNGTGQRPAAILTYLESTWDFLTQRNHRNSNYVGDAVHFHLEIWGRK